jgi:hypothetical protein
MKNIKFAFGIFGVFVCAIMLVAVIAYFLDSPTNTNDSKTVAQAQALIDLSKYKVVKTKEGYNPYAKK